MMMPHISTDALQDHVNTISPGFIVLVAVMNSAANIISDNRYSPLENLGLPKEIILSVNDSFAMIGIKDGYPGSALWA